MIVAIVGSRSDLDWNRVAEVIKSIVRRPDVTLVVSGGAIGVDRLAETWALSLGKKIHSIRPDWSKFGRRAGMIRNASIVDMADEVHAFWDGRSRGTEGSINIAKRARKPLFVYDEVGRLRDSQPATSGNLRAPAGSTDDRGADDPRRLGRGSPGRSERETPG